MSKYLIDVTALSREEREKLIYGIQYINKIENMGHPIECTAGKTYEQIKSIHATYRMEERKKRVLSEMIDHMKNGIPHCGKDGKATL
jgi:hypothetical protein